MALDGHATHDRACLYAATFLRSVATGAAGVLVGLYLAHRGFDAADIGAVVGAGLAGAAAAALIVTLRGDRLGRRRTLSALALVGAGGGLLFLAFSTLPAVAAAAFVGMVNGMGRDRGASLVIEQAILPTTVADAGRTRAFAWYNVLQDAGHALGAALAAAPELLTRWTSLAELSALRLVLVASAGLLLVNVAVYRGLSASCEAPRATLLAGRPAVSAAAAPRISPASRSMLWRISSLFALDSLAGGFLTTALLAFFFHERFAVGAGAVGLLFAGARIANAASHLAAAWLAGRIGLVNTMVFTHIPSSLLLATVPFAPNFPVAALLFLLREGLVEMDVPTRQSYVMAVVQPDERTFASGVTHLVRLGGWAAAPAFAGMLMTGASLAAPLFIGAGMKIAYDLLLFAAFRRRRPPEECTGSAAAASAAGD